jgi:hypothetical protein
VNTDEIIQDNPISESGSHFSTLVALQQTLNSNDQNASQARLFHKGGSASDCMFGTFQHSDFDIRISSLWASRTRRKRQSLFNSHPALSGWIIYDLKDVLFVISIFSGVDTGQNNPNRWFQRK